MRTSIAIAAILAAACGAGSSLDQTSADIQGGSPDRGHPAVGLVWMDWGYCTGTLIAPQAVLTGAACLGKGAKAFYTGAGAPMTSGGVPPGMVEHVVDAWAVVPGHVDTNDCPNPSGDIGLLHLAAPIAGIQPVPLASAAAPVGRTCTTVGFGIHAQPDGTVTRKEKRKATVRVTGVDPDLDSVTVTFGSGVADKGDSGAPLLCDGAVTAAASCHYDQDDHRDEVYGRVDSQRDWIAKTIAGWSKPPPPPAPPKVQKLALGVWSTCALLDSGAVRCWGNNLFGQLGDGTRTSRARPADVHGFSAGGTALVSGLIHACASSSTGEVRCWGHGLAGEMGDGTHEEAVVEPRVVPGAAGLALAGAGDVTACGFQSGSLRCFGGPYERIASVYLPFAPAGIGFTDDMGYFAIDGAGTLFAWGLNGQGQLGVGDREYHSDPVQVRGLGGPIRAVTGSAGHGPLNQTCALRADGDVFCWKSSDSGPAPAPVRVEGLSGPATQIAVGMEHACALVYGTVYCWGSNEYRQLGDGGHTDSARPMWVWLKRGATSIAAGSLHSCAILNDGSAQCWGMNAYGQLGDGTTTTPDAPVDVKW